MPLAAKSQRWLPAANKRQRLLKSNDIIIANDVSCKLNRASVLSGVKS